jgi:catechol 2,3-dioxygenase-like lactoylglutathione lyase family enzyme
MSLMSDQVNIIIYPSQVAKASNPEHWKGQTGLVSSQGRAIDHIGFSVDNLTESLDRMRKDGVKVTDEPKVILGGKLKYAFIEGPDKIRIEVVEDRTK